MNWLRLAVGDVDDACVTAILLLCQIRLQPSALSKHFFH